MSVPVKGIKKVVAREGTLTIASSVGTVILDLGAAAEKWAAKLQNPRSRLEKIGVKPDWKVSVIGPVDRDFLDELSRAVRGVSVGRALKDSHVVFVGATKEADLRQLSALKASMLPAGAIWVIRPKGRPEISERAVMAAGKAAGLVDVKVVSFSPTHTAEKFIIPLKDR